MFLPVSGACGSQNGSRDLEKTLGKVPETWPWERGFSIMSGIES